MISYRFIQRHLLQRSLLSNILSPLGCLNAIIQSARRKHLQQAAWTADIKVISVGNITSGGSGKTPFSIYLARLLQNSGLKVGISHRGYKGTMESTPTVISDLHEILFPVTQSGDEAYLIAGKVPGIPVVVGKNRKAAVSLLQAAFPELQVAILDDGLQHPQVQRNLDIVCFDADTGIGNGRLLPAGYLREPLSVLNTRCIAVVIHKNSKSTGAALYSMLKSYTPKVFHCYYQPICCLDSQGKELSLASLRGKRVVLVSGIANPDSFNRTLADAQIFPIKHFTYPDHYAYRKASEIDKVLAFCKEHSVEALICTEKDLAKLASYPELHDILLALRVELFCPAEDGLLRKVSEEIARG